jgi:hypothetical protein
MIGQDLTIPTRAAMRSPAAGLTLDFVAGAYRLDGVEFASFGAMPGASFGRTGAGTAMSSAGHATSFATGAPRITDRGLLVEEARTNSLRNSAAGGGVANTTTLPTNWSSVVGGGLSQTYLGSGVEFGLPFADFRIYGTATSAGDWTLSPGDLSTAVAAATGQIWTGSFFVRLIAGSTSGLGAISLELHERSAGGSTLGNTASAIILTASIQRIATTRVFSQATTAWAAMKFYAGVPNGAVVDMTIRLYAPQLEQGGFATSSIVTSGAAATRGGDSAVLTGLSSLLVPPYVMEANTDFRAADGMVRRMAVLSDGSVNNVAQIVRSTANTGATQVIVAGASSTGSGPVYAGARVTRAAIRVAAAGFAGAFDGALHAGGTAAAPALNRLDIGAQSGSAPLNGYVQRIRILPGDMSDAQLLAVTQ